MLQLIHYCCIKNNVIKHGLKGSSFGIENVVKKIFNEYVYLNLTTDNKKLSSFFENFDVLCQHMIIYTLVSLTRYIQFILFFICKINKNFF